VAHEEAAMVDYAFVPGIGDVPLQGLNSALNLRPNTFPVLVSQTATLANFLLTLQSGVEILGWDPANDLLVGAHGSSSGDLKLALDDTTAIPANFEILERVAAAPGKTINIPNDVRSASTSVRLLSCSIGADQCIPFLQLLKTAMGNPSSLTAPRFIHAYAINSPDSVFEWMNYEFWVTGTKPLPTRDAVVGKFGDAGFKYFDGTDIPGELWEQWVPPAATLTLKPALGQIVNTDYPVTIPAGSNFSAILKAKAVWKSYVEPIDLDPIDYNDVSDIVIPTMLNVELPKIRKYQDSHPFPVYKRYGFKTLTEFIKGWTWTINLVPSNKVKFIGSRYAYGLEIPITKPGTNEWIYNYYRTGQAPVINFTDSNQPYRLFGVV
jgi:hypothetical protein